MQKYNVFFSRRCWDRRTCTKIEPKDSHRYVLYAYKGGGLYRGRPDWRSMVIRSRSLDLTDRVCKMFYNARVDRAPFQVVNAMHQGNSDTFESIKKRLLHGFVSPEAPKNGDPKGRQEETTISGEFLLPPNPFAQMQDDVNWSLDGDSDYRDISEDSSGGDVGDNV